MENSIETLPTPYSDSLLFQFILAEYIFIHCQINKIQSLLENYKLSQETLLDCLNAHQMQNKLNQFFHFLRDPQFSELLQSQYRSQKKFKNYAQSFQQDGVQKELFVLKKQVTKAWLLNIELLDASLNCNDFNLFESILKKNLKVLNLLKRPLIKLIPQFRDDENVIFFFLSRQQALDAILGPYFTSKLLVSMFSNLQNCAQFLLKSYARRNFDRLLPIISERIDALKITAPYPLLTL